MFGTSNLVNNFRNNTLGDELSQDLGTEVLLIPTYRLDQLQEEIKKVDFKTVQMIFFLILGNEARKIANHEFKNDLEKAYQVDFIIKEMCELIQQIPNDIKVIFSNLLIRFDNSDQEFMSNPNHVRKMMNTRLKGHSKHFA